MLGKNHSMAMIHTGLKHGGIFSYLEGHNTWSNKSILLFAVVLGANSSSSWTSAKRLTICCTNLTIFSLIYFSEAKGAIFDSL